MHAGLDSVVDQGLAHKSAEKGNTADSQGGTKKRQFQPPLAVGKTGKTVVIQFPSHAEEEGDDGKEDQFKQGMVYRVQQGSQGIAASNGHQDKSDLGHGRAGQSPFYIGGKQPQQSPGEHRQAAQD